jgi:hypothetical protein
MLEYYTNLNSNSNLNSNLNLDSNRNMGINKNDNKKNILKDKFTLEKSDFQKLQHAEQQNQLKSLQYQENEKAKTIKENKNIYDMSLNSLFINLSKVSIDLVEDLTIYLNQKDKNLNNFFIIFTKGDRLIYVGILFLLLSLSLWFIDISK